MALDATNVRVGVTGAIYVAPLGTTLPTDQLAALDAGFGEVGYVTDDGVTISIDESVSDLVAWQNGDVVRKLQTSHDVSFAFAMLEMNDESRELYFGNYTSGATGVAEITGDVQAQKCFIIDIVDGTTKHRVVVPVGQVTERDDITVGSSDAMTLGTTVSCFPDGSGVKAYVYDGAAS